MEHFVGLVLVAEREEDWIEAMDESVEGGENAVSAKTTKLSVLRVLGVHEGDELKTMGHGDLLVIITEKCE
jgi:hypothetical protein